MLQTIWWSKCDSIWRLVSVKTCNGLLDIYYTRVGIESIGANLWQDHFTIFELEEKMRQKDDKSFAQLLNRIREGNHMIPQDIQILQ